MKNLTSKLSAVRGEGVLGENLLQHHGTPPFLLDTVPLWGLAVLNCEVLHPLNGGWEVCLLNLLFLVPYLLLDFDDVQLCLASLVQTVMEKLRNYLKLFLYLWLTACSRISKETLSPKTFELITKPTGYFMPSILQMKITSRTPPTSGFK